MIARIPQSRSTIAPGSCAAVGAASSQRRGTGFWVSLLLTIYASKVAWYDLRIIFESLRGSGFRDLLAAYAAFLLPFIGIATFIGGRVLFRHVVLVVFAAIGVYGGVSNLFNIPEEPLFVVQDLCKLAFIPTAFLMVFIDRPGTCDQMLRRLAQVIIVYLMLKLLITVGFYHGTFGLYYGGVADLYPFCYYAAKYCSNDQRRPAFTGQLALFSLALAILGQKRTVLVAAVAVICYLCLVRWQLLARRVTVYITILLITVAGIFFWDEIADAATHQFRRIVQLQAVTEFDEDMPRFAECMLVLDRLQDYGSAAMIFGLGHGATFENDVVNTHGEAVTHSVHFTPAAMLLRYGVVGLLFFLFVVFKTLRVGRSPGSMWMSSSDVIAMRSYGIVAVLGSFAIYGLIDDMIIGAFLGASVLDRVLANRHRRGSPRQTFQLPIRSKATSIEDRSIASKPPACEYSPA